MSAAAVWIASVVLTGLGLFQLALIAGAPLGHMAWGGGDRVLPAGKRIGSAVAIVLYVAFALVLAERAGLIVLVGEAVASIGAWVIAVYFWVGVAMNAISRSPAERAVMTPVALVLAACATVVALGL